MARYRKIDVRMWGDARFRKLTPLPPCGQGLWLFLLTTPQTTNLPGLFRAGEAALAEELGWNLEAFREAFAEASREGMAEADWEARVVWIPNAIRYNQPESANVVKGWAAAWDEIPECDLKRKAAERFREALSSKGDAYLRAFNDRCAGDGKPSRKPSPKPSRKPSRKAWANQEQEQEQEQKQEPGEEREASSAVADPRPPRESGVSAGQAERPRTGDLLALVPDAVQAPRRRHPGPSIQELMAVWNERKAPLMPKAVEPPELSGPMEKQLRTRPLEGPGGWIEVIDRMKASSFCRGESPSARGAQGLKFLLRHPADVLNGTYDDGPIRGQRRDPRVGSFRAEDAPPDAFTGRGDITAEF